MADELIVSARLTESQMAILQRICKATGWTRSQTIQYLIENATFRPAVISAQVDAGIEQNGKQSVRIEK